MSAMNCWHAQGNGRQEEAPERAREQEEEEQADGAMERVQRQQFVRQRWSKSFRAHAPKAMEQRQLPGGSIIGTWGSVQRLARAVNVPVPLVARLISESSAFDAQQLSAKAKALVRLTSVMSVWRVSHHLHFPPHSEHHQHDGGGKETGGLVQLPVAADPLSPAV